MTSINSAETEPLIGSMINVGSTWNKEAVEACAASIICVAQCSADRDVAMRALDILGRLAQTGPVSVSNSTFTGVQNSGPTLIDIARAIVEAADE